MVKQFTAMALLYALLTLPAHAESYVVNVHGVVCEFCAFGVAKKIRKLPFVDASQLDDGVRVDIENQQVFVAVKEGEALDKAALYEAIESGGYKPVKLWRLSAEGERTEVTTP